MEPYAGLDLRSRNTYIGTILAMTIMLEVGDIGRFPKVGNFTSYCRCVSSQRLQMVKPKLSDCRGCRRYKEDVIPL